MRIQCCELALFGGACFTLGLGAAVLMAGPDWVIGAAMLLSLLVAAAEWQLVIEHNP
jgi:hypothetical protein